VKRGLSLVLAAAALGAGAGWLFDRQVLDREPVSLSAPAGAATEDLIGRKRPDFTLGAVDGKRVSAADFDGLVVLLNFWATWCEPCRAEMPMLSEVYEAHAQRGFTVVGIALDDVAQAREFVAELGVAYPILVGGADVMAVGAAYGNRAGLLPYSVLVDRDGIIRWTHLGEVRRADLLALLETEL
jgi:peroxiredoxin